MMCPSTVHPNADHDHSKNSQIWIFRPRMSTINLRGLGISKRLSTSPKAQQLRRDSSRHLTRNSGPLFPSAFLRLGVIAPGPELSSPSLSLSRPAFITLLSFSLYFAPQNYYQVKSFLFIFLEDKYVHTHYTCMQIRLRQRKRRNRNRIGKWKGQDEGGNGNGLDRTGHEWAVFDWQLKGITDLSNDFISMDNDADIIKIKIETKHVRAG